MNRKIDGFMGCRAKRHLFLLSQNVLVGFILEKKLTVSVMKFLSLIFFCFFAIFILQTSECTKRAKRTINQLLRFFGYSLIPIRDTDLIDEKNVTIQSF
jgi:hypothetical protein